MSETGLSFLFRGRHVPVTFGSHLTRDHANVALQSPPFCNWVSRCEATTQTKNGSKHIEIHSVEIQSIDMFGSRVGFVKIKSDCTLVEEEEHGDATTTRRTESSRLPGICFLRGDAVTILVALLCEDKMYSLMVEQPRIPIGQVSYLELPAGMMEGDSVVGTAVMELQEECGIVIHPKELVDLTALAFSTSSSSPSHCATPDEYSNVSEIGLPPSPGGCDERVRYLYMEMRVTADELESLQNRLAGLREHGEIITVRVVPWNDMWKVSRDAKAIISLFLVEKLRQEGKLPPAGSLAKPLSAATTSPGPSAQGHPEDKDPQIQLHNGMSIPQLAFGLYMVPNDESGEDVVLHAIRCGYRHFDTASYYGNEAMLGRAIQTSGVPREALFLSTKVWNDAIKAGRQAVRQSVLESLHNLQTTYIDLVLIHWPVPGHFASAYHELEEMVKEGTIKGLGLSNFTPHEYQELVLSGITIHPVVNQFEVSPVMYRPNLVQYFQEHWIAVAASKSLNRASCFDNPVIDDIAQRYCVTPAQVMLRWCVQKGLIVVTKTSSPTRMKENRALFHFSLSVDDMVALDSLTSPEAVRQREEIEAERKQSL